MIEEIRIENLGVIVSARIELSPGLTVITGETGAGKTMVLTGLDLLLGGKADAGAVRPGADAASVEGRLVPPAGHPALALATDAGALLDDDALIVVRTVAAAGRSRAHLGGRTVPQGLLADVGAELVTVHGQSDQLRLRSSAHQRQALDAFAGPEHLDTLENYARAHTRRRALERELADWDAEVTDRRDELARLERDLERIDALEPVPGELTTLREEAERLGNVEELRLASDQAHDALAGSNDSAEAIDAPNAVELIEAARRALAAAESYDGRLADWSTRLAQLSYQASDLVTEISSYASALEADPERLEQVHERRSALGELTRAFADPGDPADTDPLTAVLAYATSARARVGELTAPGAGRDALETRLAEATETETTAAAALTAGRRAAAEAMARAVDAELAGLAMGGASIEVALSPREELAGWGAEDVELLLVAHRGAPARPLAKGASGGEMSRVMLAIEVALAREQATTTDSALPTFVFDEVDAGVGGRAAVEVGRRLAELARHTQVIIVTHLAQVAAYADRHVVVTKTTHDGADAVTNSDLREVTGADREAELARMLSGDADSDTAMRHAAELLERTGVGP
ncbi:DNA repair protein RecN [Occultella glacieicola]|uniref:DNA repair protein RecN n=1 Tax=Occultella glacieicola TaxID=2518684 RepID=A0ABY2DZH5_9MICO|nr:DNA repair protein RecN [Occultella glacieicola]TDE90288.1 DNA repair protein RecN [Occultella glacieicola]